MRLLFTCSDRPTIARNRFYREVFKELLDYTECVSQAATYPRRILKVVGCLFFKVWRKDFIFISYMGHFLVLYVRLLTKKPIVFDFYLSIYDMLCNDRKLFSPHSLVGRLIYWIEKQSLQKADIVIVDTQALIELLHKEYGIEKEKFVRLPLTINEKAIYPKEVERYREPFCVLYVGSYIPLHGTPIIIEAARILQQEGDDTFFLMVGRGPEYEKCFRLAQAYGLNNIEFKGFMPMEELNDYYNACDLNLGLFNHGKRANSVILNKTNDAFRVGKPHLTLRTDAMCELFRDNEDIFFVDDIDPATLAKRIKQIKRDKALLAKVGKKAQVTYQEKLSHTKAVDILRREVIQKVLSLQEKGEV